MSKERTITDIKIKEIASSDENGSLHLSVWYALLDQNGNEVQAKRDLITDAQLTSGDKTSITNLLTLAYSEMKSREEL